MSPDRSALQVVAIRRDGEEDVLVLCELIIEGTTASQSEASPSHIWTEYRLWLAPPDILYAGKVICSRAKAEDSYGYIRTCAADPWATESIRDFWGRGGGYVGWLVRRAEDLIHALGHKPGRA